MAVPAWICDLGRVSYEPTVELQRRLRDAREAGDVPDTLLVLEHDPVITTGHRTEPDEIAYALTRGIPVLPTERGGKATYHGPGQVVVYPVLDLREHGEDIKAYVRALEQAAIDTLADVDIDAVRRDGYPGVWVEKNAGAGTGRAHKIASIGVRVTRWVSFHGIALNVNCDLTPFGWFTPCGISDVTMTSVREERRPDRVAFDLVRDRLVARLVEHLQLEPEHVDADRVRAAVAGDAVPEPVS